MNRLSAVILKIHQRYILAASVSLATLIVYLAALRNDFVNWDDNLYIYDNPYIRALNWDFFRWAFTDFSSAGFWHPLVWISHAVDYALWGLNPAGHHLTGILLHAANTFMVVLLSIRLLDMSGRSGAQAGVSLTLDRMSILITGVVTGLLFGLHPLHVESAAWVSERKDLLSALFFLLSVMAYLSFLSSFARKSNTLYKSYILSLVFFVLALSSKTMAVSLPLVLLLLDWYPFRRVRTLHDAFKVFVEKTPFIVFSLIIAVVSLAGQKAHGALSPLGDIGLSTRILVSCKALMLYLWKMMYPATLLPFYPYPANAVLSSFEYVAALSLVVGLTLCCLLLVKKRPVWLSVWGYYLITLLPVIGIIPVGRHFMADRYTYLPSLGPFLFAGLVVAWIWSKIGLNLKWGISGRVLSIVAAITLIVCMSYVTVRQIGVWNSSMSLWNHAISKDAEPDYIAYMNRGLAYHKAGRPDLAMQDFDAAVVVGPRESMAYTNRGKLFMDLGQMDRAIEDFTQAIIINPSEYLAYNNRGIAYNKQGRFELAIEDLTKAISLDQAPYLAYTNRGVVYNEKGQVDQALQDYSAAIAINPFSAHAYANRGVIFYGMGRTDLALADYTAAIARDHSYFIAYLNRGLLLQETGQIDQALEDLNRAVSLDPSSPDSYNNRGLAFEKKNRFDLAITDYDKAIELSPGDYLAYNNRAIAFGKQGNPDRAIKDYTKALELNPGMAETYLERGELYEKLGQAEDAMRDFRQACKLGSETGCLAVRR